MAMLEFLSRREIRKQIVEACDRQGVGLDNHIIENLTNERIQAISREIAVGDVKPFDWDRKVAEAARDQLRAREEQKRVRVNVIAVPEE